MDEVRVRIRTRADGPYVIEGPVTVVDADGNPFPLPTDKPKLALCRCGASKNRPFCDGSHLEVGFRACEPAPPEEGSQATPGAGPTADDAAAPD